MTCHAVGSALDTRAESLAVCGFCEGLSLSSVALPAKIGLLGRSGARGRIGWCDDIVGSFAAGCAHHLGMESVLRTRITMTRHAIDRSDCLLVRYVVFVKTCITCNAGESAVRRTTQDVLFHKQRDH